MTDVEKVRFLLLGYCHKESMNGASLEPMKLGDVLLMEKHLANWEPIKDLDP